MSGTYPAVGPARSSSASWGIIDSACDTLCRVGCG